jgi:hypothetical protein
VSTALAIATVTAVLKDLLNDGLINADLGSHLGSTVAVSALSPDAVLKPSTSAAPQLNLYMYMTTPNLGWRNVALPARDGDGNRLSNPPLALDLHYLLSAYGTQDFHTEILLGYGMQLLHETPVLPRDRIRATLTASGLVPGTSLPAALAALATSGLADQVEQIKITPENLSVDEMSRLWTAFQSNYRPSAAYLVTVVLIQSRRPTRVALPVRTPNLKVVPLKGPAIDTIQDRAGPDTVIVAGATIVIRGHQLKGDITHVSIARTDIPISGAGLTDNAITLTLPNTLSAGIQPVQVNHLVDFGTGSPAEPHLGVASNVNAFVLHPAMSGAPTTSGVTSRTQNGQIFRSGTLNVSVTPAVGSDQRVVVLLNPADPSAALPSYSLVVATRSAPTSTLQVQFTDVLPGQYLVRVQVDGAESALQIAGDGSFLGPRVTI